MAVRRILIVDTETTGVDPATDAVIEVAAVLFHVPLRTVLWQFACLVPGVDENPVESINGISPEALRAATKLRLVPWTPVAGAARLAQAIVAHNAPFDRAMLAGRCDLGDKPWICSQTQISYPNARGSMRLTHLAADHNVVTVGAHRALADVLMMVELFKQLPDLDEQLARALKPQGLYCAIVSYARRDEAKSRGFRWNGEQRRWEKPLPIDEADAALGPQPDRPFAIRRVRVET